MKQRNLNPCVPQTLATLCPAQKPLWGLHNHRKQHCHPGFWELVLALSPSSASSSMDK